MTKPMKIPTPDLSHLSADDYDQVYEPAEDSFLMLDALELELEKLKRLAPLVCVEVGGGSGILSTALALQLPSSWWTVTDINISACEAIVKTAKGNGAATLEVVRTSVLSCLSLKGKVDLLLCNPPYVATDEEEVGGQGLSAAWAGGHRGLGVTQAVIEQLRDVLSPLGLAYVVVEQCNKPDEVLKDVEERGLDCKVVLERRAGRELLKILRISRR